jgi:hypothetical protein
MVARFAKPRIRAVRPVAWKSHVDPDEAATQKSSIDP